MTKTEKIVTFILLKERIEPHKDFHKILAKLMMNDLFALMGEEYDIRRVEEEKPHMKDTLNTLSYLLAYELIKPRHSKEILEVAWKSLPSEWDFCKYITDKKLFDEVSLDGIIDEVIRENEKAWADYVSGKQQVIGRLIGCVMKKTGGKADPEEAKRLFEARKG